MNFANPLAFIGLLSIPAIIAMYLLRQKYKEKVIPSLFLWKQALAVTESRKPWQKLRKNLLLILQLLAALLLTVATASPFLVGKSGSGGDMIIVIDGSLSMQATDVSPSRFDRAKAEAKRITNSLNPGQKAAVVLMTNEPAVIVSLTDDKKLLNDKIDTLNVSFSGANVEYTSELVKALMENEYSEETNTIVTVISDSIKELDGIYGMGYIAVGNSSNNMAVTLLSHTVNEKTGRIDVLAKVKNFGDTVADNSLALYVGDALFDVREITIAPLEEKEVFFSSVNFGIDEGSGDSLILQAELTADDVLSADNVMYAVASQSKTVSAVLFTDRNVFLESAVSLLPNIRLFKGNLEDIENTSGYYLYIYDGVLPSKFPEDGHILVFNPPEGGIIGSSGEWGTAGENGGEEIRIAESSLLRLNLTAYIQDFSFDVLKSRRLTTPEWADEIITAGERVLVYAGENEGRKIAVFGFDLHNSDLPLKKEFPIFVYNLCSWFIPQRSSFASANYGAVTGTQGVYVGETVLIEPEPGTSEMSITPPGNKSTSGLPVVFNPPFVNLIYTGVQTPGFYSLTQKSVKNGESVVTKELLAVNVNPNNGESDLLGEFESVSADTGENGAVSFAKRNIGFLFILLVILIFTVEWVVYLRQSGKLGKFKKILYTTVRIAFFVLIVLSLFDISIKKLSYEAATVFAVDLSESMGNRAGDGVGNINRNALEFIREALKNKTENDMAGAVCFGKNSIVERSPSVDAEFSGFYSHIDGSQTNISQALLLSRSIMPENVRKRITLISDGLENIDSAVATAKVLKDNGVVVDVYPITDNIPEYEAQLSAVKIPKYLNQNIKYDIEVEIYSVSNNTSVISVYKGSDLTVRQTVTLRKGANRFVFTDTSDMYGAIVYRVEIQPDEDTFYENNVLYAYTYVEDIPHILLIGNGDSANEAAKILESARVSVKVTRPQAVPDSVDTLSAYDGIVLCDVPIDDLPKGFPNALEAYVKNTGGGVIVTGGENSYALGGYNNTPLETLLPVDMELKDKENAPNLGMVIVMDRSGSMSASEYGLSRIALAKEAVARSVDALDDDDIYGVLTFDSGFEWAVEFQEVAGNHEAIKERIGSIVSMGGTSILPALNEAYEIIKNADTVYKHIILLTDGEAEKTGYDTLIAQMKAEGITLSTIAVGGGSDTSLLKYLAGAGGGRYYYTDAFSDLPKIFTKETTMAGREYLNNRYFYPVNTDASVIMNGITEMPMLGGYVSTMAKERADIDVVLSSDEDEPILAAWQYGLGRAVAFTSDMNGLWSAEWLASGIGSGIFKNTVSWVLRKQMFSDASLTAEIKGDKTEFTLTMPYETEGDKGIGNAKISSVLTDSEGRASEIDFSAIAPGIYFGTTDGNREGAYIANISVESQGEKDGENDEETKNLILGVCVPYSSEYDVKRFEYGYPLLKNIAEITGGRILDSPENVFTDILPNAYGAVNISTALLIAAILLLLIDVFIRRFSFVADMLEKYMTGLIQRISAIKLPGKNDDKRYVGKNKGIASVIEPESPAKPEKQLDSNKNTVENIPPSTPQNTSGLLLNNKKKRMGR